MSIFLTYEQIIEIDELVSGIRTGNENILDIIENISPLMATSLFDKLGWDGDKIIDETLKAQKLRKK